jgi:NADH:ubiquinone oxidoreductase subunit 4 (subunit M)
VVYSAFVAFKQLHLKRLIAYTSIIDMGIASLGIASVTQIGIEGGFYFMLSHGIVISLLFLIAGAVDESYKTMLFSRLGGIVKNFPLLAYSFLFGVFALLGSFSAYGVAGLIPLFAVMLLGALMFLVVERCFFNSSKSVEPYVNPDAEISYALAFLMGATVVLGVMPFLLLAPFA